MSEVKHTQRLSLDNPPIIEAIVDIDCDILPNLDFSKVETEASEALMAEFPKVQRRMIHGHELKQDGAEKMKLSIHQGLQAIQFRNSDGKQLVQFRPTGYSFNRLAPYEGLDCYLQQIEKTWEVYTNIVKPICIRKIGLRTINRILLPMPEGNLKLDDYLTTSPRLPPCQKLQFTGFFNQQTAVDQLTKHNINITMAAQPPEDEKLPLILDIDAFSLNGNQSLQWREISEVISTLRELKDNVFKSLLTQKCLDLFTTH